MFWKTVYQGKNSAVHTVTVSISCVDSCLAWSYTRVRLCLKTSQPAQSHSHAAELWIIPLFTLAAGSIFAMLFFLGFPLCRMQQLSTSFQPPVFGVPGLSRGNNVFEQQPLQGLRLRGLRSLLGATVPARCSNHRPRQSPPLSDLSDALLPAKGDAGVPWFGLENKALREWRWRRSLDQQDEAPGCVFWSVARLEFVEPTESRQLHPNSLSRRRKAEAWASVSSRLEFPAWKVSCLTPDRSDSALDNYGIWIIREIGSALSLGFVLAQPKRRYWVAGSLEDSF